ncbi:MAG TPA: hypothetical protein VNL16_00770 [Chloroflexota bacterium]|nr:hypothetical protein [Chloroflexota bacterium]
MGRPLGRPGDAAFQRTVLDAAFRLFQVPAGPVLVDFPERIEDEADEPLACPLPPRLDPSLPAAVDDALDPRAAYERQRAKTGRTLVGRVVAADHIPEVIGAFIRIAEGIPWQKAGLSAQPPQVQSDVRAYYEEAAMALAEHVPAARSAESWFFQHTATGRLLKQVQHALRLAGDPYWLVFIAATQSDEPLPTNE